MTSITAERSFSDHSGRGEGAAAMSCNKTQSTSSLKQTGLRCWLEKEELCRLKRPWLSDPNQLGDSATKTDFIAANSEMVLDKTGSSWKQKQSLLLACGKVITSMMLKE